MVENFENKKKECQEKKMKIYIFIKPTICFFFSSFKLFATLKCWGHNILLNLKYVMVYGILGI
jgi:hypothetical protein